MKRFLGSIVMAAGLFTGFVGVAATANATTMQGIVGVQNGTDTVNDFTNRDIYYPDGSINRGGGNWDQQDVQPYQPPVVVNTRPSHHSSIPAWVLWD